LNIEKEKVKKALENPGKRAFSRAFVLNYFQCSM